MTAKILHELGISTHSPRVGRTFCFCVSQALYHHFNSLAPCGANLIPCGKCVSCRLISTHSPRVGRTLSDLHAYRDYYNFNSLAPCGANHRAVTAPTASERFQLTRPVWGEPIHVRHLAGISRISTHSPRVGRTSHTTSPLNCDPNFNSLAPCGANPL